LSILSFLDSAIGEVSKLPSVPLNFLRKEIQLDTMAEKRSKRAACIAMSLVTAGKTTTAQAAAFLQPQKAPWQQPVLHIFFLFLFVAINQVI
jgi:hypothetical protein